MSPARTNAAPLTMDPADLIAELGTTTDLAALIRRVVQLELPLVVVSSVAVAAWEHRDPGSWAKVSRWLAARRVGVIQSQLLPSR